MKRELELLLNMLYVVLLFLSNYYFHCVHICEHHYWGLSRGPLFCWLSLSGVETSPLRDELMHAELEQTSQKL